MALISSRTILTSLCLFHITLGFFFLTSPNTIADQAVVFLLGEAMGLPHARAFETPSPALGFLAVILATVGISDLVTLSLPDEIALLHHWGTQAPLRLTISFFLSLYSFVFSPSSPLYSASGSSSEGVSGFRHPNAHAPINPNYVPSGWGGDLLKNRVFFAFAFVETISWFWVWVTLQEDKRDIIARKERAARRRGSGSRDYLH